MKERLSGIWETLQAFWEKLSRKARIVLLLSIFGIIILTIALVVIINQKEYVLLNNDFTLSERAIAVSVLSEQGIEYRMEPSGAIMVLDSDLNRAQMQLTTAGLPGSFLSDSGYNPGLTATQSDKVYLQNEEKQKYLRAIIESFEEIDRAAVIISQPERSAFALQTDIIPPSASVVVYMRPRQTLTPQQIRGILNTVRNAIPGIEEENISITDDKEGDLKASLQAANNYDDTKLKLTEEVNSAARNRVMYLLQPAYGKGNVEVQVASILDTDSKITESETFHPIDPENPERNPLDYGEHDRQLLGTPPGVVEGVPGANDNVGTPQYGQEVGENADYTEYAVHDIYDYLVSSTKEQIVKEGLYITGATAAVIINRAQLSDGERDRVIALTANAIGIPIENVTVQNLEFITGPAVVETEVEPTLTPFQILTIAGIILLLLIVLTIIIIVIVSKKRREREEAEAAAAAAAELEAAEDGEIEYDENGVPLMDLLGGAQEFEPIAIVETQEQKLKLQIKDLAVSDPEIVAQLLKTWLSAGN